MAVSIPSGAVRQPDDSLAMDAEGGRSASFSWKGPFDDLESAAGLIAPGDAMPSDPGTGWKVEGWELRRTNANCGVLTIQCKAADSTTTTLDGSTTTPIRDVWSLKSVRNDVSILAYCGSSASNPNRVAAEKWMREPDAKLANAYQYTDGDGSVVDIANDPLLSYTVPLLKKLQAGTERVIRFYPQVTRRRTYYAPPADVFENLGYVDAPDYSAGTATLSPDGLASVLSAHEWLKVQDDCDEQTDGKWRRTESWIGILKTETSGEHPWDPDLYGENRWQMPALMPEEHGAQQEGGGA